MSLCNASGIRCRKNRRELLGLNNGSTEDKKSNRTNHGNNNSKLGDLLKRKLLTLGREVVLQRYTLAEEPWRGRHIFPGKAAGVRIAGQGAPIEAAPAKKKRLGCEREVSEAANGVSDELKSERIIRLSWALVHSKQPEDMQHGIAMLEDPCQKLNNSSLAASLANSGSPLQKREKLYLLAVGYYRSGEYRRSRQLAEQCLEIAPDWMQALTLKKTLDDQITKDGLIGIGITATVVGLVAGGIAASLG
ncbi:unnamed protein product [Camellia sinensis]